MDNNKSPSHVLEAAAYWANKLSSSDCGPADRLAFYAWRDADPEHAAAYDDTQSALGIVDRYTADPEIQAITQQVLEETAPVRKLPQWLGASLAAAVALFAVIGISTSFFSGNFVL